MDCLQMSAQVICPLTAVFPLVLLLHGHWTLPPGGTPAPAGILSRVSSPYRAHHHLTDLKLDMSRSTLVCTIYLWPVLVCAGRWNPHFQYDMCLFCKYLRELKYVLNKTGLDPKSSVASPTISGYSCWIDFLLVPPNWLIAAASHSGSVSPSQTTKVCTNFVF